MKGKQTRTNSGLKRISMLVSIKELGIVTTGNTPSKKNKEYYSSNDICFVKPDLLSDSNITIVSSSNEYISAQARQKARIADTDSIFITCIGTIGKIGIAAEGEFAFNQQINTIKANKTVIPKYLAYALYYAKPRLVEIANAPVVPIINKTQFENFTINVNLDIESQRQIVSTLDKLQSIITHRKQQLEKLDELVKARFVEMFGDPDLNPMGWEESHLSEKLDVLGGYAFKSDEFDEKTGIPVLRIGNINAGCFRPVNMVYWREDENLERYAMYPGDLVMSLTGTVGKDDYGNVCILGNDYDKYYLNQRNAKLEIKEGLDKLYLSEILKFETIKKRLTGISRGVRQANITNKDILNLYIPVPPLDLQQQFAAFVAQTDKSKVDVKPATFKAQ